MNTLYLILIGISFTAGVLVTSWNHESKFGNKPVCEEKKPVVTDELKALSKEDTKDGAWFSWGEK